MKILWITNAAIGPLGPHLYGHDINGAWVSALLSDFEKKGQHQIVIATAAPVKESLRLVNDQGSVFYALPDDYPINYNENKQHNIEQWSTLIKTERPDLIQVWGTEFSHGLCALRVAKDVPAVIYMQGIIEAISRYYYAAIPESEIRKNITFRDIIKRDSIFQQKKRYERNSAKEAEMLQRAGHFISENSWCNAHIKSIAPNALAHHCPLSINSTFAKFSWDINNVERHSIMCTASGYPLKGLHIMMKALALLKKRFPDVKLYIPGTKVVSDGAIQWQIRKRGYTKYLEKLIYDYDIADNIIWLGHLSQEALARQLSKMHIFALTSSLENHSSSLKEAMMVGVPSVASYVGGIPEYIENGKNGLLYRFEEYELLSEHISALFESDELAIQIGKAGKMDMLNLHSSTDIYSTICNIYHTIVNQK